jgi:hypothetical protein
MSLLLFGAGLAVFALALWWDAGDRLRQTRRADTAFWLHLLASPLLVHSAFTSLGLGESAAQWHTALAVALLYVGIALVSLAIDRRAMMVAALAYVLVAFSALLKGQGFVNLNFAITALAIGSALLLLSAFWHPVRSVVVRALPVALRSRVAPLR